MSLMQVAEGALVSFKTVEKRVAISRQGIWDKFYKGVRRPIPGLPRFWGPNIYQIRVRCASCTPLS